MRAAMAARMTGKPQTVAARAAGRPTTPNQSLGGFGYRGGGKRIIQIGSPSPLLGERGLGGEGMCGKYCVGGRRLQNPSPPDPLSPKRGEGEKDLGAAPSPRSGARGSKKKGPTPSPGKRGEGEKDLGPNRLPEAR